MKHSLLENKLTALIREGRAMQQTFKRQIEENEEADIDIQVALDSLECALRGFQAEPEESANSSAENYRDYLREDEATTGGGF